MKVVVTGAGGFIGRQVATRFAASGATVYGVGRGVGALPQQAATTWLEMTFPDSRFDELLGQWQPDVLVHTASTANVAASVREPLHDYKQTVDVWIEIVEAVRRTLPACKLVLLSSAAVYGNPRVLPIGEHEPREPVSPYGYHKRMCEDIAQYYTKLYGLSICIARIFSAYGPGLRRQVIWDISQKAFATEPLKLIGTGDESRDFIHVKDIARAVEQLVETGDFEAGVYNIASGTGTSIRDIAGQVLQALGIDRPIVWSGQQRSGDPLMWEADISRLKGLGFEQEISLAAGLHDYARWIYDIRRSELAR